MKFYKDVVQEHFRRQQFLSEETLLSKLAVSQKKKQLRINNSQPQQEVSKQKIRRVKRRLSQDQKMLIVQTRYRSQENFNSTWSSVAHISRRIGFPYTTVISALNRFVLAGFKWDDKKVGASYKQIPSTIQDRILSKDWLEQNAHYSLKERVIIIERDFDYKMSYNCLHSFYHRNNVKPRQTRWVYRQSLAVPYKAAMRMDFAWLLANVMFEQKLDLIFFDETSFHGWMQKDKAWCRQDQVVEVALNKKQHRVTVFGAIGPSINKNMFCSLFSTTNSENFRQFLQLLKSQLRDRHSNRKVYVCIDNHSAHQSKSSQQAMKELNFVPLFTPSYSSQFNSIEYLWSLLKRHFRRFMCEQKTDLDFEQFKQRINETFELVTEQTAGNLYYANRRYLIEQLQRRNGIQ